MIEDETKVLRKKLFYTPEKQRSTGGVIRGILLGVFLAIALTSSSFLFRSRLIVFPATSIEALMASTQPKKQLVAFIGVQVRHSTRSRDKGELMDGFRRDSLGRTPVHNMSKKTVVNYSVKRGFLRQEVS